MLSNENNQKYELEFLDDEIDETVLGIQPSPIRQETVLNPMINKGVKTHLYVWTLIYLAVMGIAELTIMMINPYIGIALHYGLIIVLLFHSVSIRKHIFYRLLVVLTLPPLIRVLSLALPLAALPVIYWYLIISIPVFIAAVFTVRLLAIRTYAFLPTRETLFTQGLIGVSGLGLGVVEYLILKPQPLFENPAIFEFSFAVIILFVCTGLVEELVFRNLLQVTAIECLDVRFSLIYLSFLFAVFYIGHGSLAHLVFIFLAGCYFNWVVFSTRCIFGVTVAHALTNITPLLIIPLWLS
jgi:uncharacterized protein